MCIPKMKVTIDIILFKQRTLTNGEHPITLRLTQNRKRKYLRIGVSLHPQHWDETKNSPKNSCPNKEHIDSVITDKLSKYQKQILEFQTISRPYSLEQLIDAVEKPVSKVTLGEYLEKIIKHLIRTNHVGNANHYESLLNSLKKYCNPQKLLFIEIDIKFVTDYEMHLRSIGNKDNTVFNRLKTLKAAYNKAVKEKIIKKEYSPFEEYNVGKLQEKTIKRAISKDDVLKIINFDVSGLVKRPHSSMQFAKDLFLFSYFGCGINIMDIAYLRHENRINNRIIYKRHKTHKQINFQLQPYAIEILDRYCNKDNRYLFPILDESFHESLEQQYRRVKKVTYVANKALKKIGNEIGLSIPLTTYVARHSFATVLKRSGVNISLIGEAMGHSDLKTTQIYLDSFENSQIDEAMKNLL